VTTTKKPQGRPQNRDLDHAITTAATELLREMSLSALSMELVAQRAGVGKPTLYRRWPSKGALVIDVLASIAPPIQLPPTGDLRTTLRAAVVGFHRALLDTGLAHVLYGLVGETLIDPDLAARFREHYLRPRIDPIMAALRQGIADGLVRADLDLSLVHHLVFGPMMHSWLLDEKPMDDQQANALFDEIWTVISAR